MPREAKAKSTDGPSTCHQMPNFATVASRFLKPMIYGHDWHCRLFRGLQSWKSWFWPWSLRLHIGPDMLSVSLFVGPSVSRSPSGNSGWNQSNVVHQHRLDSLYEHVNKGIQGLNCNKDAPQSNNTNFSTWKWVKTVKSWSSHQR